MEKLINKLKELGFNTYEAKVYIALLKKHPATGYELSKVANIPQARTYDTLKSLQSKEIVLASNTKPVEYIPVKPKDITKKFRKNILSTIDYLDSHLPDVKEHYNEPILNINSTIEIQQKILESIKHAEESIYLEIWSKDFNIFEEELRNAYNRNVEIRIVGYDNLQTNFGLVYQHPFSKNIMKDISGRNIIICVDNTEGGVGKIYSDKGVTNLVWTRNEDMIYLIREFIVHDMFILDMQENMLNEMIATYGKGLKHLHDKILGRKNIFN